MSTTRVYVERGGVLVRAFVMAIDSYHEDPMLGSGERAYAVLAGGASSWSPNDGAWLNLHSEDAMNRMLDRMHDYRQRHGI